MANVNNKEVKLASEKQIQMFNTQVNNKKYDFIGKDVKKLSSFEISILIDYLINGQIKDTDYRGDKLTGEQIDYRKDVIAKYLKENQNKVLGMVSSKQVGFIIKLLDEKGFEFTGDIKRLTSKEASSVINHLTGQKEDAEISNKYLKSKGTSTVEVPSVDREEPIPDFDMDIPDPFDIPID